MLTANDHPLSTRPDSYRRRRFINHLLSYLLTYIYVYVVCILLCAANGLITDDDIIYHFRTEIEGTGSGSERTVCASLAGSSTVAKRPRNAALSHSTSFELTPLRRR